MHSCCLPPGQGACPEAVLPDRALYLPTFSHLLIVKKLLSLSLSLSLRGSLQLSDSQAHCRNLPENEPRKGSVLQERQNPKNNCTLHPHTTLKRIGFFCFPIKHSTHTPSHPHTFLPAVGPHITLRSANSKAETFSTFYCRLKNKYHPERTCAALLPEYL